MSRLHPYEWHRAVLNLFSCNKRAVTKSGTGTRGRMLGDVGRGNAWEREIGTREDVCWETRGREIGEVGT